MRTRGLGWAGIVMAWAVLAPSVGRAQTDAGPAFVPIPGFETELPRLVRGQMDSAVGYAPPPSNLDLPLGELPSPLYSTRPESGPFAFGGYALYVQNVPLEPQNVAIRGFLDFDGNLTGSPGRFVGSGLGALDTQQLRGPQQWQPGFFIGGGYRFKDGSAVTLKWLHLVKTQYDAVATLTPAFTQINADLSNTFLFSPVFNFPSDFSGPPNDVPAAQFGSFGIWNAADIMTIDFVQRNEIVELTCRVPIHETECWRSYGLVGPQFVWFWERFRWRTTDLDDQGVGNPFDTALYTNIASNRMYGLQVGCGNECYLGHGLSVSLDLQAGLLLDIVKQRVKYERGDRNEGPERKRSYTDYTVVPEVRATLNAWWFPYEGIQMKLGYDAMGFFNTFSSQRPIDFNYGSVDPQYDRVFRYLHGLEAGIAFIF